MNDHAARSAIFWPMIALAALTALVWMRMYAVRFKEMRTKEIGPQSVADSRDAGRHLQDVVPADNFRNLFEIPVLFFAVCLSLAVTGEIAPAQVVLAWIFVILRTAHSLIHLTYNRVTHRFAAHFLAAAAVFSMWSLFAIQTAAAR